MPIFRHLCLFSGIGGFALAAREVWKDEYEAVAFCDNDGFCQSVLRKHWPEVPIYGDIRELNRTIEVSRTSSDSEHDGRPRTEAVGEHKEAQPQEQAGTQLYGDESQGTDCIRTEEVGRFSVVADTDSRGLEGSEKKRGEGDYAVGGFNGIDPITASADTKSKRQLCEGLEKNEAIADRTEQGCGFGDNDRSRWTNIDLITGGFPCQSFSYAGKRRGRSDKRYLWPEMLETIRLVGPRWVLAENVRGLLSIEGGVVFEQVCADLENLGYQVRAFVIPACAVNAPHRRDRVWIVAHASSERLGRGSEDCTRQQPSLHRQGVQKNSDAPDSECVGWQKRTRQGIQPIKQITERQNVRNGYAENERWSEDWPEVAARLCRMDDGVSSRLVRLPDGTEISGSKWRIESLKALGNSIVWPVAAEIMRAMKETDGSEGR